MLRTRFAPSPTGFLHIGGLKTAFYAWLIARQQQGKFLLRIEDTDRNRFVEGGMEQIIWSFQWAGLEIDEGPHVGGAYGPYVQSERLVHYQKYCAELIAKEHAYYCFCTPERLEEMRNIQAANKQAPRYDRTCLKLSKTEVEQRLAAKERAVVRMKVPDNQSITVHDLIKGDVTYNTKEIDDQVLLKSDGFPTYHLAVVVDDHLMEITHVIRADEWLPSTPKHIILYDFFGWKLPQYAHVPPLLGADGKKKLSKRDGSVSVDQFDREGYLPDAMMNYLALSGWNPGTTQEIFTPEELIKAFSLERCQKAGAIFDYKRLNWMNGQYIRMKTPPELGRLVKRFIQEETWYKEDDAFLEKAVTEAQQRMETLVQGKEMLEPFYRRIEYGKELILNEKMKVTAEIGQKSLALILENLKATDTWEKEVLQKILQDIVAENGLTNGQVFWPLRAVLSGKPTSPGAFEMAYVLGKEETMKRIVQGLEKLGE